MKRILLSYLFDFSGHHRACLALRRGFLLSSPSDVRVEILSPLKSLYPVVTPRVERIYHRLLRHAPAVWGALYDRAFVRNTLGAWGVSWLDARAERLGPLIAEHRPDGVVCTQAVPCLLAARYKARRRKSFRLFAVLTDHHPHAFWADPAVDAYFVPSRYSAELLQKSGVEPGRIHLSGIPVDPDLAPLDRAAKQRLRQRLGLRPDRANVLVMGGSQGHIPARALLDALARLPDDFQVTVVAGRNQRLFKNLKAIEGSYPKPLRVFPYVDRPEDFLESADVLVTKGGGLTTAEALVLGVPTVVLKVLPGQEGFNARILAREKNMRMASNAAEAAAETGGFLGRARASGADGFFPAGDSHSIGIADRVLSAL